MKVSYESYHAFSAPMEGRVPTMYCDCLGLITTGVGNLINTPSEAEALPWKLHDGSRADLADVRADWNKLHDGAQHYAKLKWTVYANTMRCHLEDAAIDALVRRTLAANEVTLRKRFDQWDSFPADAQLAIMSMAWAVGAGFYAKFPMLSRCIDAQDWDGCIANCKIREEGNPGVVPRNAANRFCFHNAALVKKLGVDTDTLYWPGVMSGGDVTGAHDAKADAEAQLAAWHALDLCPFGVDASDERDAALQESEQ